MKKIFLNDKTFEIEKIEENTYIVNGEKVEFKKLNEYQYIIKNNIQNIISGKFLENSPNININGKICEFSIKDKYQLYIEALGVKSYENKVDKYLKSEMPGQIVKILVEENQEITKGQNLLILSAMKMENEIKAKANTIIKKILVSNNQIINKGDKLIEFE